MAKYRFRVLTKTEAPLVFEVLKSQTEYSQRVAGCAPSLADAQACFAPPAVASGATPVVYGLFDESDQLLSILVALADYPDPGTVHIALLITHAKYEGNGHGAILHDQVVGDFLAKGSYQLLRAGVVGTNEKVAGFWEKLGYAPSGEAKPYLAGSVATDVKVYHRPLDAVILHLAKRSEWQQSIENGCHAMSMPEVTLEQEGFMHTSFPRQLPRVLAAHYVDVDLGEYLILQSSYRELSQAGLAIKFEPGSRKNPFAERYMHIYQPVPVSCFKVASL